MEVTYIMGGVVILAVIGMLVYFAMGKWHCDKCKAEKRNISVLTGSSKILGGKTFCGKCAELAKARLGKRRH